MKKITKLLTVALSAALLTSVAALPASATVYTDQELTRISNPNGYERQMDGLVPDGDRETSYAWCMASRGKYIYIGTNKNIVGGAVESAMDSFSAALEAKGISRDSAWVLADFIFNSEVPRPKTEEGGQILRVNCLTNEIDVIYTAPAGTSFRMAITHGDNVFFGSYSAGQSISDDTVKQLSNDIFRIDANDNVEKVFESFNGTSMRAACEYDGNLFFGGVDEEEVLDEGWNGAAKLAILKMDEEDNSVWNRVADYRDFGKRYAMDPAMANAAASPVWDICSYDGYIYATLPSALGFVMFKGHPAADGETANEYGWYWQEVVGLFNGKNPIGLNPDASEKTAGLISLVATPVVFNNELYVFDFDNTIGTEIQALSGVLGAAIGMDVKASDYLRPMYTTLRHTQGLWKLNNDTGVFEKVEAFSEIFKNTTVEYVWRAEVYNDNLYITTMDSAVLYNYITKLTNGSFVKMSSEEWKDLISNVTKLSLILKPEMGKKAAQIRETIDQVTAKLKELQAKLAESGDVQTFIEELNAAMSELKTALAEARIVLAENQLVQQIMAQVKSQALVAQDQLKAVKAQVAAFIADFDLFKFIAPDLDVPISTLSDEELDELMDTLKTKLLTVIEKMKVEIPELKPIDIEAVKMAIADFAARAIDKTIGQKLYEAILNLNAAFEERVTELTNKTVTDISEIIKSKLLAIAEKLPEDKQAIIQKLTELSVKNLIDSIVEEYSEKLMEAEEKIKALKSMTIGDYQTYADSMIDMMANAAIKQLTAVNEKLKS